MDARRNFLPADMTSHQWRLVTNYCQTRIGELTNEACNLTTTDAARRDAAVRIDELQMLMRAPNETLQARLASETPRGAY